MRLLHVVGARPNFMKAAPVIRALSSRSNAEQTLVHTGQHYDPAMSAVFFAQLGLPTPDVNLGVGGGSHAEQTARLMTALESVLLTRCPDWTIVYGDVNSTLAAALVCSKLGIRVAHVESGLRSFDRAMPEEINRVITDQLADMLFTPSEDGNLNLRREGVPEEKMHLVGNVMIDTLVHLLPQAEALWRTLSSNLEIETKKYGLVTLHRPSNVDESVHLASILSVLDTISRTVPLIFPVHPRTKLQIDAQGMPQRDRKLQLTAPCGYLEFLCLQKHALFVITDSGGIQEETTFLDTPCLTLRDTTERPITIELGTNKLIGTNPNLLVEEVTAVCSGQGKRGQRPPLWDGCAAKRIADVITLPQ